MSQSSFCQVWCHHEPGSRYHGVLSSPSYSCRIQGQEGPFQKPDSNLVCLVSPSTPDYMRPVFKRGPCQIHLLFRGRRGGPFFFFWRQGLKCPNSLSPLYAHQAHFQFRDPPASDFWMFGLKVPVTMCSWKEPFSKPFLCKVMCVAVHGRWGGWGVE